jgi:uncharacterized protein
MAEERSFLGQGWSFPPVFNKKNKKVEMVKEEEDIRQSLQILLSTRIGERVMRPDFGCNLDEMLFENLDITLKTYVTDLIESAILYFEPRIELNAVEIQPDNELEGVLMIHLIYTIRSTNTRNNFVYPFYKYEGTNI